MIRKALVTILVMSVVAGAAYGKQMRTLYTKENRLPEKHQLELGAKGFYREFPEEYTNDPNSKDEYSGIPYLRFALFESFAVYGEFPVMYIDPRGGNSEFGPGDFAFGAELVAWEDIFGYPYIIPHAEVTVPSGDEDKGMGAGTTLFSFGVSAGQVVEDVVHFIADATYTIYRTEENIARFSGSIIWDVSEIFSIHGEVQVTDEQQTEDDSNHPVYIVGGMSYEPLENLGMTVYGGGASDADADVIAGFKVSWSFF